MTFKIMYHIGLFEGIGGFSLAARAMGWETVAMCEINPFCQKVLSCHFPNAYLHGDIHTLTGDIIENEVQKRFGTRWRANDIVLTGGFPCQPFSVAGQRKGNEDDRALWPEMRRAIREIKPQVVVGENVPGLLSIEGGMVFQRVCLDLENEGYEVQPVIIPACAKGAPHRRDRIWIIAHSNSRGCTNEQKENGELIPNRERDIPIAEQSGGQQQCGISEPDSNDSHRSGERPGRLRNESGEERPRYSHELPGEHDRICGDDSNVEAARLERGDTKGRLSAFGRDSEYTGFNRWKENWIEAATRLCGVDVRLPGELDGITFSKWRTESLKGYGNSIQWEVALEIFKAIEQCKL